MMQEAGKRNITKPTSDEIAERTKSIAMMKYDHVLYRIKNGQMNYMVGASKENDEWGVESIQLFPFVFNKKSSRDKNVKAILRKISALYDNSEIRKNIVLYYFQRNIIKCLLKNGFHITGITLIGGVEASLMKISDVKPEKDFSIEKYDFDKHARSIKEIKLELMDRLDNDNREDFLNESIQEHYFEMLNGIASSQNGHVFILLEKNKVAGLIASMYFSPNTNNMHIADVFVRSEYQGNRCAYVLYKKILEQAKADGKAIYSGVTTTKRILKMAKSLDRKKQVYYLTSKI